MTELDPTNKIFRIGSAKKAPARPARLNLDSTSAPTSSDRVTLSHKPKPAPQETKSVKSSGQIREQLVSKFRDILEQGTYKIKAEEIANKMVQKIQEEKDKTII